MRCLRWLPALSFFAVAMPSVAQIAAPPGRIRDNAVIAANEARLQRADRLRREGEEALRKGEKAQAVTLFQQALEVDPDLSTPRILLADIYIKDHRPADVVAVLEYIVHPLPNRSFSEGSDIRTRMKYVLALLDLRRWEEAATLYEQSIDMHEKGRANNLHWNLPGFGIGAGYKDHWLPDLHFKPETENFMGLAAQAHLVLGVHQPGGLYGEDALAYMLDHVQQALKYERRSQDAQFIRGVLLGKLRRFAEASAAFAIASKNASPEVQEEIRATLRKIKGREKLILAYKERPVPPGKAGYYEASYIDKNGKPLPNHDATSQTVVTVFLWHPASPANEPPLSVIISEDGIPDPAHPGKTTTRYRVIQNPGLRFTISSDDVVK